MVNLVRLLVQQGVLSKDKGDALMAQALAEARTARAGQAAGAAPTQVAEAPAPAAGTIRVPYVPEVVRDQIKQELRTEVLAQAKAEGWAAPGDAAPEWVRRIRLYGDLRLRTQQELYSRTNSNNIFDFERINLSQTYPILDATQPIPFLNTRADRYNVLRFRARLGVHVDVVKGVEATLQLATGDDNGPISTNQFLAGGLSKRNIWLQEAYIKAKPTSLTTFEVGRFPNPFNHTDLLFDEDLALDGVFGEVRSGQLLSDRFGVTLRGGAFPLDFGDPNFVSNDNVKRSFPQRYMFSGQVQLDAKLTPTIDVTAAAAYHTFQNIQGQLSAPCIIQSNLTQCSTDYLRPQFLVKGNTVFPLRAILDTNSNTLTNVGPQVLGYTFGYRLLNINGSIGFPIGSLRARVIGDYVQNLAFRRSDLCRNGVLGQPLNNGGTNGNGNICDANPANRTSFVGGNQGYQAIFVVGPLSPQAVRKRGQWRFEAGYRYLESDATLDSFTDSDFRLGGTNGKGYFLGARYALVDNLTIGSRWLSGNEVSGDPLQIDVLQFDLEAHF